MEDLNHFKYVLLSIFKYKVIYELMILERGYFSVCPSFNDSIPQLFSSTDSVHIFIITILSKGFLNIQWGLHGSYGLIWLMKSYVMPDLAFERPCTIGSSIAACWCLFVLFM